MQSLKSQNWRYREALRAEIGSRLWQFLPHRREWPDDYRLLIGAGLLLQIGCSAHVGRDSAVRLMEAFTSSLPAAAISKSDAHVLYSFIWNVGVCWASWHDGRLEPLMDVWDLSTQDRMFKRLKSLIQKARTDEDKLDVFALAGLLAYVAPPKASHVALMLKRKITRFPSLIRRAEEMPFVPAALASIGLSLIGPPRIAFSKSRLERIIATAAEYYEVGGPAIEHLIDYLRRISRADRVRR